MQDIKFEVIKKIVETNFKYKNLGNVSKLDSNSPPSVFIGSKLEYPLVNVGIISPLERDENSWLYDDAKYWAENNFSIGDVLKLRNSLLNSRFQSKVKTGGSENSKKFVDLAQEIAVASMPVDVEIELKRNIGFDKKKDRITMPQGMNAPLKKAKITGNVKIHRKVDKVINDEMKAVESIEYLHKNKFSEYVLSKILSVGVLGLKKDKRLVPTRWSITATDDMLGNRLLKRVRDYKWIENYELFFGEFLGNQYMILLLPNVFSYELFELYMPKSSWNPTSELKASTDSEGYYGRKSYASSTAGGYYATRLPILEYLDKIKRQASVFVIRIETPNYWAGLGVWVVRESVRKALNNRKIKFDSYNDAINSAKQISKVKYNFNLEKIIEKSDLLKLLRTQTKLISWF